MTVIFYYDYGSNGEWYFLSMDEQDGWIACTPSAMGPSEAFLNYLCVTTDGDISGLPTLTRVACGTRPVTLTGQDFTSFATKEYVDSHTVKDMDWAEVNGNVVRTNGNVGINTSNPESALHIYEHYSGSGPSEHTVILDAPENKSPNILFKADGQTKANIRVADFNKDQLQLMVGTPPTAAVNITTNQNVGIGTNAPQAKLQINGDLLIGELSKQEEFKLSGSDDLVLPLGLYTLGTRLEIVVGINGYWSGVGGIFHVTEVPS